MGINCLTHHPLLISCLLACLIDWLIDWLTDWLINWLIDWLIDWLILWLTDWLTDWPTDRSTDWLSNCLIDCFIHSFSHSVSDFFYISTGSSYQLVLTTSCQLMTSFRSLFYELRMESGLIFALGLNSYLADVISCSP